MKTLKIEIPKGYQIDNFDTKNGEIKFKEIPKDIKERIKSFDDVLKFHGITTENFAEECNPLTKDEVAYRKVKLIVEALNEDWKPDWGNHSQTKYVTWFNMGSSGSGFSCNVYGRWGSGSSVGSRLCFKSADLARYAGQQFEEIYKDFFLG